MDYGGAMLTDSTAITGNALFRHYPLTINNSMVTPDVLNVHGRESLSAPFSWTIEFTTPQANIAPERCC